MRNLKKLTLALLIAILLIGVTNIVLATEADENITFIPDETANVTTNDTNTQNTNSLFNNANTNNVVNNTTNNVTNNGNSSQYNNTSLPAAGSVDSITVVSVIAVFGVVALYAYKKIRDYNIK